MSDSEAEFPLSQVSQSSSRAARKPTPLPKHVRRCFEDCLRFVERKRTKKDDDSIETCFFCKQGGSLLLCDDPHCCHGWHVRCAGLKKTPEAKFRCPWHVCSVCSVPATTQCVQCPNAYCEGHFPMRPIRRFKKSKQFVLCPDCTGVLVRTLLLMFSIPVLFFLECHVILPLRLTTVVVAFSWILCA